jgi:hypothetical protein
MEGDFATAVITNGGITKNALQMLNNTNVMAGPLDEIINLNYAYVVNNIENPQRVDQDNVNFILKDLLLLNAGMAEGLMNNLYRIGNDLAYNRGSRLSFNGKILFNPRDAELENCYSQEDSIAFGMSILLCKSICDKEANIIGSRSSLFAMLSAGFLDVEDERMTNDQIVTINWVDGDFKPSPREVLREMGNWNLIPIMMAFVRARAVGERCDPNGLEAKTFYLLSLMSTLTRQSQAEITERGLQIESCGRISRSSNQLNMGSLNDQRLNRKLAVLLAMFNPMETIENYLGNDDAGIDMMMASDSVADEVDIQMKGKTGTWRKGIIKSKGFINSLIENSKMENEHKMFLTNLLNQGTKAIEKSIKSPKDVMLTAIEDKIMSGKRVGFIKCKDASPSLIKAFELTIVMHLAFMKKLIDILGIEKRIYISSRIQEEFEEKLIQGIKIEINKWNDDIILLPVNSFEGMDKEVVQKVYESLGIGVSFDGTGTEILKIDRKIGQPVELSIDEIQEFMYNNVEFFVTLLKQSGEEKVYIKFHDNIDLLKCKSHPKVGAIKITEKGLFGNSVSIGALKKDELTAILEKQQSLTYGVDSVGLYVNLV